MARFLGLATQPENHLTNPVNKKLNYEVYNTENFSAFYVSLPRAPCQIHTHLMSFESGYTHVSTRFASFA